MSNVTMTFWVDKPADLAEFFQERLVQVNDQLSNPELTGVRKGELRGQRYAFEIVIDVLKNTRMREQP